MIDNDKDALVDEATMLLKLAKNAEARLVSIEARLDRLEKFVATNGLPEDVSRNLDTPQRHIALGRSK